MTPRATHALRLVEWLLFAAGGVLAAWCLVVVGRAEYYARLPIPAPAPPAVPGARARPDVPPPAPVIPAGGWVARLEAPELGLSATVLEGSDDATLSRAAGHIEGTPLPGERGNIGIAGHRDTTFRPLRRVKVGDELTLTTAGHSSRYRVSSTFIVDPDDVYVLDPTDRPALTLVTCYPFHFIGHAPRRFIVRADLVDDEPRLAARETAVAAERLR